MVYDGKHISIDEDRNIRLNLGWRDPETGTEEVTSTVRLGSWPRGITWAVSERFGLAGEAEREYDVAMEAAGRYFEAEGEPERHAIVDSYRRASSPAHV